MKKIYSLAAGLFFITGGSTYAQSMSEYFDTLAVGSYMGVNNTEWTTWSGTTGGAEDVQVSDAEANSGTKSIYFNSSTAGGGPQDVVVPFGGEHNTGHFNFNSNFLVAANRGAYFNFQANNTVGQLWSFNCQMHNNGSITFDDGASIWLTTTYPQGSWFNIEIDVDLNTNSWEILIDGVSQGTFQAVVGQIASIDIYPVNSANGGNGLSTFYMDDFNYTVTPFALPAENGAVSYIEGVPRVVGASVAPTVTVRNLGTNTITSFDLEVDYNGNQITENITGVSIPSMGEMDVDFSNSIPLVAGAMNVTATISNVNGNATDGNPADDSKFVSVNPITPAAGKMVVGEEGTGTWCGWCPRGTVMMDRMEKYYSELWAGIAVHNGDPMVYDEYDAGIGSLIGGYPSGLVDRKPEVDPGVFEAEFLDRVTVAPNAFITNGAEYDAATGFLKISVTADFQNTVSGQWKLACVITEDSLYGTSASWAQANYYSGGGEGEMGGYELLPDPVPASQMVYDHVARVILPDFNGHENSFPSTNSGESHTVNFTLTADSSWDMDKIHIIGMLIDNTGDIDNAGKATLAEAETNGFVESDEVVASVKELDKGLDIRLYPNPANESATIALPELNQEEVMVTIFDMNGKTIISRNYGILNGTLQLPIHTADLDAGIYSVQIHVGDRQQVEKLIVQ
ncbi:MAG: Omp28-related outer membrane protein [Crocinitomicaceae bacterium]